MTATAPNVSRTLGVGFVIRALLGIVVAALCLALIFYLKDNDFLRDDYPYIHSSYNWTAFQHFYPVSPEDLIFLPTGVPDALPQVQYAFQSPNTAESRARRGLLESRALAVKNACRKTWSAYSKYALPHDELRPLDLSWTDPYGGWGATLVDGLDTLWIMELKEEFYSAVKEVALIDWTDEKDFSINLFETTIRHLGGLLAAYDLSEVPLLLRKAQELADMLLVAFDTPNHMPPFWFTYERARAGTQVPASRQASAPTTSLCLEFTRLAQLTGEDKYYGAVHRISLFLAETQNSTFLPGMWPDKLDFWDLQAEGTYYTMGADSDSLYEYLLKMHVLLAGTEPLYKTMYAAAAEAARRNLLFRPMVPPQEGESPDVLLLGSASVTHAGADPVMVSEAQHLGCFTGGMFALGGKILGLPLHVDAGDKLARGCAWAYSSSPHGVMPEIATLAPCPGADADVKAVAGCAFNLTIWQHYDGGPTDEGPFTDVVDGKYILRPEAIESLFVLYRVTGREEFQDMAWDLWTAIVDATETEEAFAAVKDVSVDGEVVLDDEMESFWVAETLKYFYLIFSPPDLISLDDFVFNTEAHPFKRTL